MKTSYPRNNISWLFAILTVLSISMTQSYAQENRKVGSFTEIGLSISADVYFTQATETTVRVEGNPEDIAKVITEVNGDKLRIRKKTSSGPFKSKIKVFVTAPNLEDIGVSGSGSFYIQENFETEGIELAVSGSGDIIIKNMKAGHVEMAVSGSGEIEIAGPGCDKIEIGISGSGEVHASNFEAKKAEVHISGSGEAKVFVSEKLESRVSGSGEVYYKGNPLVDASASGSGRTKPLN